jgi:hypothetical protein
VEADGQLITIDSWARSQLIRIDPVSGDRTIVMRCCPDLVGTPFIENYNYTDLAIEADGNLILTGHGLSRRVIIRVNPRTGLQILVSGGPFATDVSQSSDSSPPVEDSPPFDDDAGGGESGFKSRPFHLELGVQ